MKCSKGDIVQNKHTKTLFIVMGKYDSHYGVVEAKVLTGSRKGKHTQLRLGEEDYNKLPKSRLAKLLYV